MTDRSTVIGEETEHLRGLTSAQVQEARAKYGSNILTPPERDPWWVQFLSKFDDPVIRILIIAAVVAIGVGAVHGEYIEGLGIVIAILLATALAFINEYKAGREFDILNKVNDDVPVKAIRDGNFLTVPKRDLVVGDAVLVEVGEEIPADGRVAAGVSFQVDESKLTGESVPAQKLPTGVAPAADAHATAYPADRVLRGTIVADGHGTLIVSAVGDSTEIGKTARAASEDTDEETPLNVQLNRLSKLIGVVGLGIAALIFAALTARGVVKQEMVLTGQQWTFFAIMVTALAVALSRVWLPMFYDALELSGSKAEPPAWLENSSLKGWLVTVALGAALFALGIGAGYALGLVPQTPGEWLPPAAAREFLTYFMIAVTIIVVAVPEGLAMSVTLSLAYSMRKMTASNNLVRRLHACETIGAATVICSDKTGTLTQNEMRVHAVVGPALSGGESARLDLSRDVDKLVAEGMSANSTANLGRTDGQVSCPIGNPTECALLLWLEDQGQDYILHRTAFQTDFQWTFSTERKFMATVGQSSLVGKRVVYAKGAPEIVLARCTQVCGPDGALENVASWQDSILQDLKTYQARGMRTLGLAYRALDEAPAEDSIDHIAADMIWIGFAAIADPVREEVPGAIKACRAAGIDVKIVTGDNAETAREIARQIGLASDGIDASDGKGFLTGDQFGKLSDEEALVAVRDLKVLSRARPMDKMRLVRLLQDNGHVVAVTGDGTNDAPALNYANVGLSMGKSGTSVAKEASDIILLDDSFQSIVNAVMWGRSLYQNIQKFILFQLTINVAALCIALLGPFIGIKMPLTVIQMLWVNLIMDTFAALALATEPPSWEVMKRPPRNKDSFIVSPVMATNIFTTAAVFVALFIVMLMYAQKDGVVTPWELSVFFTVFVLLQFWNLFNARTLGTGKSAFHNLMENKSFLLIAVAIFAGQVLIVQFAGALFRTVPLSLTEWVVITAATSVVLWAGELWRLITRGGGKPKDAAPAVS